MTNTDVPLDTPDQYPDEGPYEPVTSGWLGFAGLLLILIGTFKLIEGIWALWNNHYKADLNAATYMFNLTGWGWIHIILGIVLIATGVGILGGQEWARGLGIGLAGFTAIMQLLYLPFFTGSLINILLCVLVIYALVVPPKGARAD